jgi:hypothetical protein
VALDPSRAQALTRLGWILWLIIAPLNALAWFYAHSAHYHHLMGGTSGEEISFCWWVDKLTLLTAIGSFAAGWVLLLVYGKRRGS